MEVDTNMINEQVFNSEWYEHNIPVWGKLVAVTDDDVLADNRQIIDPDWTTKPVDQYTVNRDLKSTVEEYKEENVALNNKVNTFVDKYDNLKDRYDGLVDKYTNLHLVASSGDYRDLKNRPILDDYATQAWVVSKLVELSTDNISVAELLQRIGHATFSDYGTALYNTPDNDDYVELIRILSEDSSSDVSVPNLDFDLDDRLEAVSHGEYMAGLKELAQLIKNLFISLKNKISGIEENVDQIEIYGWGDQQEKEAHFNTSSEGVYYAQIYPTKNGKLMTTTDGITCSVSEREQSWIHPEIELVNGQVYVNIDVAENTSAVERIGYVRMSNNGVSFLFKITQAKKHYRQEASVRGISYSVDNISYNNEHETIEMLLNVNFVDNTTGTRFTDEQFSSGNYTFKFEYPEGGQSVELQAGHSYDELYLPIDADNIYNNKYGSFRMFIIKDSNVVDYYDFDLTFNNYSLIEDDVAEFKVDHGNLFFQTALLVSGSDQHVIEDILAEDFSISSNFIKKNGNIYLNHSRNTQSAKYFKVNQALDTVDVEFPISLEGYSIDFTVKDPTITVNSSLYGNCTIHFNKMNLNDLLATNLTTDGEYFPVYTMNDFAPVWGIVLDEEAIALYSATSDTITATAKIGYFVSDKDGKINKNSKLIVADDKITINGITSNSTDLNAVQQISKANDVWSIKLSLEDENQNLINGDLTQWFDGDETSKTLIVTAAHNTGNPNSHKPTAFVSFSSFVITKNALQNITNLNPEAEQQFKIYHNSDAVTEITGE